MSTPEQPAQSQQPQSTQNTSKPITAAFDLQTKIRVIIQEVLAATMRKLSQFNEKVETFQKFFFTYTQRINEIQEKGKNNEQSLMRMFDTAIKNKQGTQTQLIKLQEKHEKMKIQKNQLTEEIKQINKKIKVINRQNQTINNQFSNTKKKFLQFSQQMTNLKQQVAWKITKYVQQTAQINTKIQINNQQIKTQYFNINLALQKNKQKYEQIISTKDIQQNLNTKFQQAIENINADLQRKQQGLSQLNKKMQQMDTALYAKIKATQSKLEKKIEQLIQNNTKIMQSVNKVDSFAKILQEIRQDSQKTRRQLLKKFEESDQKHTDRIQKQILSINTTLLNSEKTVDKKIRTINQTLQKNSDFFTQKMQYLKIQIQSQISSKATKMVQQKSKSQSSVSNSIIQSLQQRINKINLDTKKQITKLQNNLKDVKLQVKHQVDDMKQMVQTKITTTIKNMEESSGSGVSPQFIQSINEKIQKVNDAAQTKLFQFGKQISQQNLRIQKVQVMKTETQQKFIKLQQENTLKFSQFDERISNKVQRVLYTVTKLRGDSIIKNEFIDKQIKQLKKITSATYLQINTVIKMFPAIGQCINLVMCLIFDAQFQHAKIIQDNLPSAGKQTMKFQNMVQGILYQYMEKKKPGYIIYRHKQQKKTDIVKATFMAYTQIWQDLFGNDFKDKQQLIPKAFYRKYVQKSIGKTPGNEKSPGKQSQFPNINNNREYASKETFPGNQFSDSSGNNITKSLVDGGSDVMNRSFHVRKKKLSTIKNKDDMVMVLQEDIKESK